MHPNKANIAVSRRSETADRTRWVIKGLRYFGRLIQVK